MNITVSYSMSILSTLHAVHVAIATVSCRFNYDSCFEFVRWFYKTCCPAALVPIGAEL